MFETIKKKAKEGKAWVKDHKEDLKNYGYYALGAAVGITTMTVLNNMENKKVRNEVNKYYSNEKFVLSQKGNADWIDFYSGTNGPTVGELSDNLIENGAIKDARVVGALVYSKNE